MPLPVRCRLLAAAFLVLGVAVPVAAQPVPPVPPATPAAPDPELERQKISAEDAYKRGDFTQTVELTNRVLKQAPNDHVALYLRGSARVEQGVQRGDGKSLRDGIADAREAIRLGGGNQSIYYLPYLYGMTQLSLSERRADHAKVSVQIADQALANTNLKPDEKANLTYQRGLAKSAQGQLDEAVADFEAAIRLNTKFLAAYTAAADALARSGKADQARTAFNRAVQAFPDNPLVYNNRGMFLQQVNKLDEAVADFTRAIEIDGNYFYSYTNRGFTLMKKGDLQAAEADFSASLKANPSQPMVYGLRGNARFQQGKADQAISDHRKAVELSPNSALAHTDLGFTLFFAGRYADAIQEWELAQKLSPQIRHVRPWTVAALEELGRGSEAKTRFASDLQKPAQQWDWIDHLLAFQLGRIDAEALTTVAGKSPEPAQRAEAEYFIGRRLAQEGQAAEAQAAFKRAVDTGAAHLSAYRGAKLALQRR